MLSSPSTYTARTPATNSSTPIPGPIRGITRCALAALAISCLVLPPELAMADNSAVLWLDDELDADLRASIIEAMAAQLLSVGITLRPVVRTQDLDKRGQLLGAQSENVRIIFTVRGERQGDRDFLLLIHQSTQTDRSIQRLVTIDKMSLGGLAETIALIAGDMATSTSLTTDDAHPATPVPSAAAPHSGAPTASPERFVTPKPPLAVPLAVNEAPPTTRTAQTGQSTTELSGTRARVGSKQIAPRTPSSLFGSIHYATDYAASEVALHHGLSLGLGYRGQLELEFQAGYLPTTTIDQNGARVGLARFPLSAWIGIPTALHTWSLTTSLGAIAEVWHRQSMTRGDFAPTGASTRLRYGLGLQLSVRYRVSSILALTCAFSTYAFINNFKYVAESTQGAPSAIVSPHTLVPRLTLGLALGRW